MKIHCVFDDKDFIDRYNNSLIVSNGIAPHEVIIQIVPISGGKVEETAVDGNELIKAIQNAMNV